VSIADHWQRASLPLMRRALRLLLALAVMLMPVGLMPAGHFTAAAPAAANAAASSAHCAEMGDRSPAQPRSDRSAECAIACAALPSVFRILERPEIAPAVHHSLATAGSHGLTPDAATPPPRLS
jgi:hypothetical protein